jgi:hypothetical protein
MYPTLLDLAKRQDPDGTIADIVELLNQTNQVLDDMVWVEGNLETGHRSTVRTGLPSSTWRKLYGGVMPSKSKTAQVTDNTGMLEAYAEVDKALADLNGRRAEWRLSEDKAFIESMSQEMAETVFYGNEGTEPEAFTGFAPRYNDTTAGNGGNIILGGSSDTDNQSIWLVGWGPDTVHGIIPKGSTAGLQTQDLGEQTKQNADGSMYQVLRTHYRWDAGLAVRDWRYVVRIANIEKSALTADASAGAKLLDLMDEAIGLIPSLDSVRPAFYMSRTLNTYLRKQARNAVKNSTLTIEQVEDSKWKMSYDGIPIRRVDKLAANEALVA